MATTYYVLRKFDDQEYPAGTVDGLWQIVAEGVEAGSAESACRMTAKKSQVEGEYRAVPESSFRTVTIVKETEPRFVVRGQTELEGVEA